MFFFTNYVKDATGQQEQPDFETAEPRSRRQTISNKRSVAGKRSQTMVNSSMRCSLIVRRRLTTNLNTEWHITHSKNIIQNDQVFRANMLGNFVCY